MWESINQVVGRRLWIVVGFFMVFMLPVLAKAEAVKSKTNRVSFISMLKKKELEAVHEMKSEQPQMNKVQEIIQMFRNFVTQQNIGPELRLRSTLALAVVCYWRQARDLCRRDLQSLGTELEDRGELQLAQVVKTRVVGGEGRSLAVEGPGAQAALYHQAIPGIPNPEYP